MKDVRKLVPRTPPEGLLEWAAERHKELDQDGLLIETEWAQDWSLEVMLDEWAENRKVRPSGPPARPVRRAAAMAWPGWTRRVGVYPSGHLDRGRGRRGVRRWG